MSGAYDEGRLLLESTLDATARVGEKLDETVERLKIELYPYYPKLMLEALNKLSR